jgi:hypothetical protein
VVCEPLKIVSTFYSKSFHKYGISVAGTTVSNKESAAAAILAVWATFRVSVPLPMGLDLG